MSGHEVGISIFGWELYRDENKEIIKIVLLKDNIFKEFIPIENK